VLEVQTTVWIVLVLFGQNVKRKPASSGVFQAVAGSEKG